MGTSSWVTWRGDRRNRRGGDGSGNGCCSVTHRETLPRMLRRFQFVDEGDRVILHRNPALAVRIGEQLVGAEAELAGALAGVELGWRRQEGPVEFALAAQNVEEAAAALGFGPIR